MTEVGGLWKNKYFILFSEHIFAIVNRDDDDEDYEGEEELGERCSFSFIVRSFAPAFATSNK